MGEEKVYRFDTFGPEIYPNFLGDPSCFSVAHWPVVLLRVFKPDEVDRDLFAVQFPKLALSNSAIWEFFKLKYVPETS